jgi:hypothetical protein
MPDEFEKNTRVRVGGSAIEGGRWHGRLIALVALVGAALLVTLIVSASLDPPPAPAVPATASPTAILVATPSPTAIPAAHTVAWVMQDDAITRWDSSGAAELESPCRRCTHIARPNQPPLFIDLQDSGAMAIYDPLDRSTTRFDLVPNGLIPPPLLSPDGQQFALRTFGAAGENRIMLADLATGTAWTLLDDSTLSADDAWLLGYAQLQVWDRQYLYALSANWGHQVLWRIQLKPKNSEGPQLAPEILLDVPMTSSIVIDPVFGRTAYITPTANGAPELRVRGLYDGSDQAIASDVYQISAISPDGSQLVYRSLPRGDGNGVQRLVLYNLNTSEQHTLVSGANANAYGMQWSQRGEYLLLLYPPPSDSALIFRLGESTPVVRLALDRLSVGADMTSSAEFVLLSYTDERYYLTIQTWYGPESRRVIPLGTEPATLVYVP